MKTISLGLLQAKAGRVRVSKIVMRRSIFGIYLLLYPLPWIAHGASWIALMAFMTGALLFLALPDSAGSARCAPGAESDHLRTDRRISHSIPWLLGRFFHLGCSKLWRDKEKDDEPSAAERGPDKYFAPRSSDILHDYL